MTYSDLNDLHDQLTLAAIHRAKVRTGGGYQIYGVSAKAHSCEFQLDLKDLWLTSRRWKAMCNQYLDQDCVDNWLFTIGDRLTRHNPHGVAFLRTNEVEGQVNTNGRATRRWGSCMLGFSFRVLPTPTLTMHSRSSHLGYIAQLDLAMAHKLAEAAGERVGITPADIRFNWFLEQGTVHRYWSLPWWFSSDMSPLNDEYENPPLAIRHVRATIQQFEEQDADGVLYGDMRYSRIRTVRRKWHAATKPKGYGDQFLGVGEFKEVTKPFTLKSVPLSDLVLMPSTHHFGGDNGFEEEWDNEDLCI